MDANFWLQRWDENNIGFHGNEANAHLVEHFPSLGLPANSRVFLPLCGKTLDIAYLLSCGFRVVGAELSEKAIEQLFDELGVRPDIVDIGGLKHYRADNLDIFVGDIFHVSRFLLGTVDAIYDRAALVALPPAMRKEYSKHLMHLTETSPQLLITYEYDQTVVPGPPFSVSKDEVHEHYDAAYTVKHLARIEAPLRGSVPAEENVWLLQQR